MKRPELWFDGQPSLVQQWKCLVWRAMADPRIGTPKLTQPADPRKFRLWNSRATPLRIAAERWRRVHGLTRRAA